jgi:proteic killer suppression protein
MDTDIQLSKQARKDMAKAPKVIQSKLLAWVLTVQNDGLPYAQKLTGFRDEALQGERKGQRSIRLNRQWRAIYEVIQQQPTIIALLEVTPHDYRTR